MKKETINGVTINYRDNSTDYGVIKEVFFEDPYKIMDIPSNSTVIDIGAHIGTFSIRCANEKNCIVYAYEPCKDNYKLLVDNINNNKLNDKIKSYNNAISNKSGSKEFYIDPYHYGCCSFYMKKDDLIHPRSRPYYEVNVECITLKQIFDTNKIIRCNVLKLDCEQEEKHILLDKDSTEILKNVDIIILEHHRISDAKDIANYLTNMNFVIHSNNNFEFDGGIIHAIKRNDV